MVNTKKMKGLVYELIEKYPEEKEILEELLSSYENPYYHYCILSSTSCIEDHNIPNETVEYEEIVDGTADDLYMQNQDDEWDVFEVICKMRKDIGSILKMKVIWILFWKTGMKQIT